MKIPRLFQINLRIQVYDERDQEYYYSTVQDVGPHSFYISEPMSHVSQSLHMGINTTWKFCLIREDAIYHFLSKVVGRKTDQILLWEVMFPEQVYRQQRRNYFRFPCSLELEYWVMDKEEVPHRLSREEVSHLLKNWDNPLSDHNLKDKEQRQKDGELPRGQKEYTVDLSGGGLQLVTTGELSEGDRLLLILNLEDKKLMIRGKVARSYRYLKGSRWHYRVGVVFVEMSDHLREDIISYIFQQMRQRVT